MNWICVSRHASDWSANTRTHERTRIYWFILLNQNTRPKPSPTELEPPCSSPPFYLGFITRISICSAKLWWLEGANGGQETAHANFQWTTMSPCRFMPCVNTSTQSFETEMRNKIENNRAEEASWFRFRSAAFHKRVANGLRSNSVAKLGKKKKNSVRLHPTRWRRAREMLSGSPALRTWLYAS